MKKASIHLFVAGFILLCISCKTDKVLESQYQSILGKTMGTYYKISYESPDYLSKTKVQSDVDSILLVINDEMSTYIDSSFISRFNSSENLAEQVPRHFQNVFRSAKKIHEYAQGSFDPTIMPLVNYWGFGYTGKIAKENWDSTEVAGLLSYVGLDKISLNDGVIKKQNALAQLDFSAIAKGYAADQLAEHLRSLGLVNLLVDIGGDGYAQGKNKSGNAWRLGINTPAVDAPITHVYIALEIDGKGLATSGNYRNYYKVDGELYGHTINVKTGFPYKSNVLSASIIAETAMEADALATTCMATDLEGGLAIIEQLPNAEAYLIYEDSSGKMQQKYTSGFKDYILE